MDATSPSGFDAVLATAPPGFEPAEVVDLAERTFRVHATTARDLGSERDQTFLLLAEDATPLAVMKVSNVAEDPATLDMEAAAVLHIARVDPTIPVAIPWPAPGTSSTSTDPADRRVTFVARDGTHHVRMYDVLPGSGRVDGWDLPADVLASWGVTTARVGRALRGFFHPAARRTMLWDVQHAARTRELLDTIAIGRHRELVEAALDRFDAVVTPIWPTLRAQVIHTDLTTDNALVDADGRISGIVDFGDMSHSALITDIASLLDSLLNGREGEELFRCGRLILDGYQRISPLEPVELALTGELLAARAAVTIAISSFRSSRGLEDPVFAERYNEGVARTVETLLDVGWDEAARRLGGEPLGESGAIAGLIGRREAVLGPAIEPLTYAEPIQVASAEGVWITAADGRRYLDAYNNVPCVGHSHPRVAEAIARTARTIATNMRYLHPAAIELAERLVATMPPGSGLDTVLFVNSGSEANDVAWRLATTFTGNRGALCTAYAYHGVTEATAAFSPESLQAGRRPEHVETWEPPDAFRGNNQTTDAFDDALARLAARGLSPAATILDGVLTSDGFLDPGPALATAWVDRTHTAGGLWIADEVQGGHGRTGSGLWSFERLGIVPDFVTLGKPMGNGHPVGAVITRREIAARFADETVFFSTFGGNQVSAAAALAVLDVLRDERVLERVVAAGEALQTGIRDVADRYPVIGDVRGVGLAIGVEVVSDPLTRVPDRDATTVIKERLKKRGVLVGTTGRAGNILKIRPPLAFDDSLVHIVTGALEASVASLSRQD